MLTLLSELKLYSVRDDEVQVKDGEFGAFKYYHDGKKADISDKLAQSKKDYAEKRGSQCATVKSLAKSKNSLKILEDELKNKKIVYCEWSDNKTLNLMLSSGLLIFLEFEISSGDIERVTFDRYFIQKIVNENICDVIITRQHIIISYNENQITFVHLQKPSLRNTLRKISAADPKIFNIIILGGNEKKVNRNLVINQSNDLVLIWTKSSQNEFFPWRPIVKDQERANLHIYKLNRLKLEPLCFYWTENDPICFEFSKFNENEIHSVEQKISKKGEVTIESCRYKISNKSKISRISVTSIPLHTEVSCNAFSPDHEKLVMCCIDGSVVLFDSRGITLMVKAPFIPTLVSWHPDNSLFTVGNERGQCQCFDISLSWVKTQLLGEDITPSNVIDLSSVFAKQPTLLRFCWSKKPDLNNNFGKYAQTDSFFFCVFESGSFATLRYIGAVGLKNDIHTSGLTGDVIVQMYISMNQLDKAINVLLCLNWDTYGAMCLLSLHKIANQIFKQPATPEKEALLQKALGSFHSPSKALCAETENEFGDNVDDITRRFFHYLIRFKSFEKAFSLAIDINDADLFMILYKTTKSYELHEFAEESLKRADEIYAKEEEDNSHHSTCSLSSCSICTGTDESESENDDFSRSSVDGIAANHAFEDDLNFNNGEGNLVPIKKSFSADLLNHPPLPKFPRYRVKKTDAIPPLPLVSKDKRTLDKPELEKGRHSKNARSRSLEKLDMKSEESSPTRNNTFASQFQQKSSMDSFYFPPNQLNTSEIDQTLGIPVTNERIDAMNAVPMAFYPSLGPYIPMTQESFQIPTTIHQYPLISATIPSTSTAKSKEFMPYQSTPVNSTIKDPIVSPASILLNSTNISSTNPSSCGTKKDSGEKNKVKFSDVVNVAVVPEIPRKEKFYNMNDRVKRRPFDPRRELAESLPLFNPEDEYLKDFQRFERDYPPDIRRTSQAPNRNGNEEHKKKSTIKVVHFGVV